MTTTISAAEWDSDADLDERESVELVLRGALDRIRFGWHQGGPFGDLDGRNTTPDAASAYCLLGAIDAETTARGLNFVVAVRARHQIALVLGDPAPHVDAIASFYGLMGPEGDSDAIAAFNDTPGRAKDEVIAVLRRSVDALESSTFRPRPGPPLQAGRGL